MLRFKNQTNEENYASNELMWNILNNLVPIGSIIPFGGNNITSPMFKLCDGSVLDRIKYKVLFGVIGTTYGEGDGVSTFNLPNLIGRFLEGATEVGEYKEAGLPNIAFKNDRTVFQVLNSNVNDDVPLRAGDQLFSNNQNIGWQGVSASGWSINSGINFDASKVNNIYGKSTTVQPNSVTCKYIMRVC